MSNVYGFIYKTILPDGRFYIGQHKIVNAKTLDPRYFGSGVIIKAYIKAKGHGQLTRTILKFGYSHEEMNTLEKIYVPEEVLQDPLCINLDNGGRNNFTRYPEVKQRIGQTMSMRRKENPTAWPSRTGKENNKSVNWKLISPAGEEFIICGGLKEFCKNKGISVNTIKKAISEGWIPRRGTCAGWQAFNLDQGIGTTRDTHNHGESHSGLNNPWFKKNNRPKDDKLDMIMAKFHIVAHKQLSIPEENDENAE